MSDNIEKVLESGDQGNAPLASADTDAKPNDSDLAAQLEAKNQEIATLQERYRNVQSDRDKKVAAADKLKDSLGQNPPATLDETDLTNKKYLSEKLGYVSKDEVTALKAEIEAEKKAREEMIEAQQAEKRQTRQQQFAQEMDSLAEKHKFIKKTELADYIISELKQGKVLSPTDAARLKYFDQFVAAGAKPNALPTLERSAGGRLESSETPAKSVAPGQAEPLTSKNLADRINERLFGGSVS